MNINGINEFSKAFSPLQSELTKANETSAQSTGFTDYLNNAMAEVNALLNRADEKAVDMASGKAENLHSAMIAFEKAETSMKLLVQVRNKALEAYNEIIRMQV